MTPESRLAAALLALFPPGSPARKGRAFRRLRRVLVAARFHPLTPAERLALFAAARRHRAELPPEVAALLEE